MVTALERERVPYVVVVPYFVDMRRDPVIAYVRREYERVELVPEVRLPPAVVFARRGEAGGSRTNMSRLDR